MTNFALSNPNCPIEQLELEKIGDTDDWKSSKLDVPKIISNVTDAWVHIQMPNYKELIQRHAFIIKAIARGGAKNESDEIKIMLKNCDNLPPE